ncbi:MAG: hypothetical protein LUE31_01165 [Lachnospiraceae bacterium]|nr:hypothetical protein [Lachnospiraceae bacterium]
MERKIGKYDLGFLTLLVAVLLIHLSRVRLGYADMDESFYLTVPYRILQGDSFLVDEWHLSQLVAFLTLPLLKIYLLIFRSTEGIYLAFRYIYLAVLTFSAALSYVLLRGRDKFLAAASSLLLVLFVPFGLRTMGYNQLGLLDVWMFAAVMLTNTRHFQIRYIAAGFLLAAAVLCNPYMVILYLLYALACLWRRSREDAFGPRAFGWLTVGCAIPCVLFFTFLLYRASPGKVLENLPYIFQDPAHVAKSFGSFFSPIVEFVIWFWPYFVLCMLGFLAAFALRRFRRVMFQLMALLQFVLWVLLRLFKSNGVGKHAIMLPLTLLGLMAFLLTEKKSWDLFLKGWMVGIIYAVCMNLSSNQGIYVICNACAISTGFSLFLIKDYLDEDPEWNHRMWWLTSLIVLQLLAEVWINMATVFWEDDTSSLTALIEQGPQKGIYTTERKKEIYDINYENLQSLGDLSGKNFVCFNYFPCAYLIVENARNGGFSAWLAESENLTGERAERFQWYYELHPEKEPDVIYIDVESSCTWSDEEWEAWCEEYHYTREVFERGGSVLYRQGS